MEILSEKDLDSVNGGVGYMNTKTSKLQKQFERACRLKRYNDIVSIAGELQARGLYGWAKDTAASFGINSL